MHPGFAEDGPAPADGPRMSAFQPARPDTPSERVREIRRRIADDAYRAADVVDEIARRILLSREL